MKIVGGEFLYFAETVGACGIRQGPSEAFHAHVPDLDPQCSLRERAHVKHVIVKNSIDMKKVLQRDSRLLLHSEARGVGGHGFGPFGNSGVSFSQGRRARARNHQKERDRAFSRGMQDRFSDQETPDRDRQKTPSPQQCRTRLQHCCVKNKNANFCKLWP